MIKYTQYIPNWYQTDSPPYEFEFSTQEEMEADDSVNWAKNLYDFLKYAYRKVSRSDTIQLVALRSGGFSDWYAMGELSSIPGWLEEYEPEFDKLFLKKQ